MSTMEPTVALVFSPEPWVEALHRHLAHHGGARVRQIVVDPAVALDEEYGALVVSDRWPALTLGFVGAIHERARKVLGVFDPDEPAGKDHLVALGVDATIATDAPMAEFVAALSDLEVATPGVAAPASAGVTSTGAHRRGSLVAVSGPRGGGITEVAVGLAAALARRRAPVVLIDAHEAAPAVAGRLGVGLEPNLRSAVDACAHGLGALDDTIVAPATASAPRSLGVVAGFPSPVAAAQVTTHDVVDVVQSLRADHDHVVVDVDDTSSTSAALIDECSTIVAVVGASPVGVVRALEWIAPVRRRHPETPLHVAVNRAPSARYQQEEIRMEITRAVLPTSITWLPADRAVDAAAWNGDLVTRGAFHGAIERLARTVCPAPVARRRWMTA
jgi:MinD-like ATPase involved in chromosome partitioning or flagellar assembly